MPSATPLPLEIDCRSVERKLRERAGNFVLVDCREQEEYDLVHIDGAILLPMSQLADRANELEPLRDQEVVVHCHHGGRSLRVANWLRQQGYPLARSMSGGIDQWASEIDSSLARY